MTARLSYYILEREGRHNLEVPLVALALGAAAVWAAITGFPYYRLPLQQRVLSPLHSQFRPSGYVGIRLGLLAVACFLVIYLYAIRKRSKWLSRQGKTKNWLDLHVVLGIAAPVFVTLHSAFKMRGIAGLAYWIMMAVTASGVVGRYLYAQIPRRINAAELSLQEMHAMTEELAEELHAQSLVSAEELAPLLAIPTRAEVDRMSVPAALFLMLRHDLRRPLLVARLRRRSMPLMEKVRSAGGLRASREKSLEKVIELARNRAWLAAKVSFLAKTQSVFHLWHVVHRPFSYSFAILAAIHIGVVVTMGYF